MTVKISNLPAATSVGSGDVLPVVQSGTTKKIDLNSPWSINIDGGNIDGTPIGANSADEGKFTTLDASGDVNFDSGQMFFDASANSLGIRTSTPSAPLHIVGEASGSLFIDGTDSIRPSTDDSLITISGGNATNSGANYSLFGGSHPSLAKIHRWRIDGSEAMRIDSSGNVGIGTTSPDTELHVAKVGGNPILQMTAHEGTQNADAQIQCVREELTGSKSTMRFSTNNGTALAEAMRIDSSGNVLIGKTTTAATARGLVIESIGEIACAQPATGRAIGFLNSGTGSLVGSIVVNASSTSYNTSSDYRLKENAQPITGALAKVQALNPVRYNWKADGSEGEGFIAHELQEVVPYAVTGEKDGQQMQAVDYGKLTTLLTAAIKELKAELDELKGSQ